MKLGWVGGPLEAIMGCHDILKVSSIGLLQLRLNVLLGTHLEMVSSLTVLFITGSLWIALLSVLAFSSGKCVFLFLLEVSSSLKLQDRDSAGNQFCAVGFFF